MIFAAVNIAVIGFAAYIAYVFIQDYRKATGSTWEKLLAAGKQTETILVQRAMIIAGGVVDAIVQGVGYVDPNLVATVQANLKPEYVIYFTIGMAVLTEIARRYKATDVS